MKRYLVSFFLSVLLSFLSMLLILLICVVPTVMSPSSYVKVVSENRLAEKLYDEINLHFIDLSGSSNIPASIFEGTVSKKSIEGIVPKYTKSLMSYAFNKTDEIEDIELDLNAVENAITEYFEKFAKQNNITLDDAFYNQRDLTIREVTDAINEYAKMSILKKGANIIRPYSEKIGLYSLILGVILSVIALFVAYLILRTHYSHSLYWIASSIASAALLLTFVFGGMRIFGFFDGFVVSETVVKTVVTGISKLVSDTIIIVSSVILGICAVTLVWFLKKSGTRKQVC